MESLRTPDDRFADLPDFPWKPHHVDDLPGYEGLRMAFLDEGPREGHVFLCLHGEPTWSYLYRRMIPVFLQAGGRVVAPDFFGFGRSDKPVALDAYSWDFHRGSLTAFIAHLGLERVTLVCQDWGGVLGLTLPVDHPELVERLLVMNTALATGVFPGKGFLRWKEFCLATPDLDVGRLVRDQTPHLTDAETAGYDAPFPDARYKAGVRTFPALVPIEPDMDGADMARKAAIWWSTRFRGQSFMAIGASDPVLGPKVMNLLRQVIRGCPQPLVIDEAGHFVQEWGDQVARAALESWATS